jgi:hypothetical protein
MKEVVYKGERWIDFDEGKLHIRRVYTNYFDFFYVDAKTGERVKVKKKRNES